MKDCSVRSEDTSSLRRRFLFCTFLPKLTRSGSLQHTFDRAAVLSVRERINSGMFGHVTQLFGLNNDSVSGSQLP